MLVQKSHLHQYVEMFLHRQDIYAVQKKDGSYFLVREPITFDVVRRHLEGEITCGWYALRKDSTVRWLVLDADQDNGLMALQQDWARLQRLNITAYLENSRRGGHLWIFTEPINAYVLRTLVKDVHDRLGLDEIEIYPRQDELPVGGVGSLVRGPLGIHQLTGKRYYFLDPVQLQPLGLSLADQLDFLMTFQTNPVQRVADALAELRTEIKRSPLQPKKPVRQEETVGGNDKIGELKTAIGDLYTFVSQYVDLNAKGRGSCPFHPPDRHPSFAVNRKKGYWVCFHETNPVTGRYLGGDAIEFYCRLKGLDFKEAVCELAQQYGITDLPF